jgi:Dolichyl-phosphate-mannose-protein mannosyltransferase
MVARHDWSSAYVNGVAVHPTERTLDWIIAASYKLLGVADWAARLPIALCVLALAVIAFFLGRKLFVWNAAGLYAALIVLTWPGTFVATRDLTPVPLLCVASALIALALWYLLAEKRLAGWNGIGASTVACILMLLIAPWPAVILPLVISVSCWVARGRQQPLSLAQWPLLAWAVAAFLLGDLLEAHPHNPLTWLGPVLPVALLLGGWLANREAFADRARTRRMAYAVFVVGLAASALLIFFAVEGPLGFSFFTSSVVLTSAPGPIPFIILSAALIAGVTGNLVYRLHNNPRAANCFLAGMLAGVIVAVQAGFVVASPAYSSQILADAIRPELGPADVVVVDGKYPEASSFAFYLERPILLALPQSSDTPNPVQAPTGKAMLDRIWNDTNRVYLWTRVDHPFPVPGQSYIVAASGGKEILSNQPNSGGASF